MDLLLDRSGDNILFKEQSCADRCYKQFDDKTICNENYVEIKVHVFFASGEKSYFIFQFEIFMLISTSHENTDTVNPTFLSKKNCFRSIV